MNDKKPTAKDRRLAAARAINAKWMAGSEYGNCLPLVTLETAPFIAREIRDLVYLGRTERWINAVHTWAQAVESAENIETLRWAYTQYGWDIGYAV